MTELERLVDLEASADAARMTLAERELSRSRGVAWSGMAPEHQSACPPEKLRKRAQARLATRQAWRAGADGAFVTAVAHCQAAARQAFTTAERARAGASREEPAEWRQQVLDELSAQARALAAGVRQARQAPTR
jgi:type VI protein secretion system component VasF